MERLKRNIQNEPFNFFESIKIYSFDDCVMANHLNLDLKISYEKKEAMKKMIAMPSEGCLKNQNDNKYLYNTILVKKPVKVAKESIHQSNSTEIRSA